MICPSCKSMMAILELDGVEIDNCFSWHGIWLDSGELEILLKDSKEKDSITSQLKDFVKSSEKKVNCPICGKKMAKARIFDVLVDVCKKGHGIWFDGGELQKILELADITTESEFLSYFKEVFRNRS